MHTSLNNKTALITGVTSGIGREIAQLLAERGARVFGTVRNPQSANPIRGVEIVGVDVTDDASVRAAVQSIEQKAGPVQLLVNNAGYSFMGALEETSIEEARQQFETNLFGVLRVTNAILPGMRRQGFGRIVNISSVLGFLPAPYWGIYAASKHAVEGYTETLDHEIRRFGVRALLVQPAYTKTKLNGNTKSAKITLAAVADEVSFVKSYRQPLMIMGLLVGGLTAALMAGWSSKPATKDPRLQSPRVEIVKAQAAGAHGRTFTGVVEARVQSDLGFRVGGKILERSVMWESESRKVRSSCGLIRWTSNSHSPRNKQTSRQLGLNTSK